MCRDDVRDDPSVDALPDDDADSRMHGRFRCQHRVDFSEFDSEPSDLDLVVCASEVDQCP